jgi:hypothetical protein
MVSDGMKTVLFLVVTFQTSLMAPRKLPHVPDVVFPPVPDDGKTRHLVRLMKAYVVTLRSTKYISRITVCRVEYGGRRCLRNVYTDLPDNTESHPGRQ